MRVAAVTLCVLAAACASVAADDVGAPAPPYPPYSPPEPPTLITSLETFEEDTEHVQINGENFKGPEVKRYYACFHDENGEGVDCSDENVHTQCEFISDAELKCELLDAVRTHRYVYLSHVLSVDAWRPLTGSVFDGDKLGESDDATLMMLVCRDGVCWSEHGQDFKPASDEMSPHTKAAFACVALFAAGALAFVLAVVKGKNDHYENKRTLCCRLYLVIKAMSATGYQDLDDEHDRVNDMENNPAARTTDFDSIDAKKGFDNGRL